MKTAQEAFKKSTNVNKVKNDKLFSEIEKGINEAILEGRFELALFNTSINEDMKKYLTDLGYVVDYRQSGFNEYSTFIHWGAKIKR